MNEVNDWMLITYYCPIYGNAFKAEPIQVTRQEISNALIDKGKSKKNNLKSYYT